jgi:hypothetical protein
MISKAPSRPFSLQVLQACKALSNVYLQSSAHRALGSQSPTTRFSLSFCSRARRRAALCLAYLEA